MFTLTKKQKSTLQGIRDFYIKNNHFPSTRELGESLEIKSSNTIFKHLEALLKKGFLKKNSKGKIIGLNLEPLTIKLQDAVNSIPIPIYQESIAAGFQAPAEDSSREMMTVDQYLIKNSSNTFAIKVKGFSMEKAGILPGDLLLVEKRSEAKSGQIVIAHLPTGFTVKRLLIEKGQSYLKAESSHDYQIKMEEGTNIWGVVIGIVRKYQT